MSGRLLEAFFSSDSTPRRFQLTAWPGGGKNQVPEPDRQYGKWSKDELRRAESTASQFLEENSAQIADTMRAKARFLETLIQQVSSKKTTFDDRLEFFARISEIAKLIQDDADGFFELASQPMVARILGSVPRRRK
jgi:hypothetical protein